MQNLVKYEWWKLDNRYGIDIPIGRFPMIRITGFLNNYDDTELLDIIKNHNEYIIWKDLKRSNSYGKLQVDPLSFSKIMRKNNIRIGWDICRVSEGFGIVRCYNAYDHISSRSFWSRWKISLITPIHKNGTWTNVENYRGVAILPTIAKFFENLVCVELTKYFKQFIPPFKTDFAKDAQQVQIYQNSQTLLLLI